MNFPRMTIALAVSLATPAAAFGQMPNGGAPAPTASTSRQAALTEIREKIRAYYVFPEMRDRLIAAIDAAERDGRLADASEARFTDALTRIMRETANDGHLSLVHDPQWVANFAAQEADPGDDAFEQEAIASNYGIQRTELLVGNIRYARITGFGWVNDRTGRAYDELMRFLGEGDAIIIDIRGNSGGDHNAVRYLVSHFLDPETKLYRFSSTRGPEADSFALTHLPAGRIRGKPLYVLIDRRTVSAGEDLAYQVQQYRLGELVGTRTPGHANNNEYFPVAGRYRLSLSVGRPVHPVSNTNWEGRGIEPSLAAPGHEALDRAIIAAVERLLAGPAVTPIHRAELQWTGDNARGRLAPVRYAESELGRHAGRYGEYVVALRSGRLWLESRDRDPLALMPLADRDVFALEGRDYVRVAFRGGALRMIRLGAPEDLVYERQ